MSTQYLKRFAIIFDEERRQKNLSYFKRLINAVSEKLGTKKSYVERFFYNIIQDHELDYRDAVDVNIDDLIFDYIPRAQKRERLSADIKKYFLMRDFRDLVDLISSYCEEDNFHSCRKNRKGRYDIEVTIEVPRKKKVTVYDKVTILERWVKVGYDMYRKQFDPWTGREYVVIDGDVYDIKRNRYGKEYLQD
jgi:hypothetical protein